MGGFWGLTLAGVVCVEYMRWYHPPLIYVAVVLFAADPAKWGASMQPVAFAKFEN